MSQLKKIKDTKNQWRNHKIHLKISTFGLSVIAFTIISACTKPNAPTESNFVSTIDSYLSDPKNTSKFKVQVKFPYPKEIIFAHTADPTFPPEMLLVSDHSKSPRKVLCITTPNTDPDSSVGCGVAPGTEKYYKKLIDNGFYKKTNNLYESLVVSQNPAQNPELLKKLTYTFNNWIQAFHTCKVLYSVLFPPIEAKKACNLINKKNTSFKTINEAHKIDPQLISAIPNGLKTRKYPIYIWTDKLLNLTEHNQQFGYVINIGTYTKVDHFVSATQPSPDLSGVAVSGVKVFLTPKIHEWAKDLVKIDTSPKEFTFIMEQLTNGWKVKQIKGPDPE